MKRTVKKADVRREEIIEMSQKLFLQGDYESTTMNQIIQELKIAKGTVYHYFSSKDDLLDAVVDDFVDRYIESVQVQMKEAPKNAVKKLALLVR